MREPLLTVIQLAVLAYAQDGTDSSLRPNDYELLPADDGNVLVPPYWDLAQKATTVLTASSTCGSDPVPDRFCDIYFDDCDFCNGQDTNSSKRHPIENVIDNTENFWMSPPLSKNTIDKDYSEVNITIDLQQPFHVAYVTIKYAMSPRAKTWVLEKSLDGENWEPWQYFARTQNACQDKFGVFTSVRLTDSTPICTQEYTDFVPAKNGEVIVSLINDRPSMNSFASSEELQEFVQARFVRIRLLEVNTLLSHLMSPQPDATAKQRYFYSIKKIEVGGRCVCNGHANRCHQSMGEFKCDCQHNTEGTNCERCKPNYVQKKWKPGMPDNDNVCEECNCHGHATVCKYVEEVDQKRGSMDIYGNYVGGGVCQNCQGNTFGNNCEQCKPGFWRSPDQPKTDPCQPCDCTPEHSLNGGICDTRTGQCTCETNFGGRQCNQCQKGKYYYPHCDRDIHLPPEARMSFPVDCGTCSTDLMDAVLPQTDTIKKTVVSLNHVKANKLTMTKFQYLSNMSQPIEHDRQNIEAGINLLMNYDERMDEVQSKICGPNGLAEKKDALVSETDQAFQALHEKATEVEYDADKEHSRAESFVGDFEMIEKMSNADYEVKMEEARNTVDHLEQIVINNPYEPLKDKAQEEFDAAATLLENVKERFGGTQRTGRCNTHRSPVDYSRHRYEPANSENFKFTPGDIDTIDIDGQPLAQDTYYHPDYSPLEPVDNSHIFAPDEVDRTQIDPTESERVDYDDNDYNDYPTYTYEEEGPYEYVNEYSDEQTDDYPTADYDDETNPPFTISTDMHTIGPEDGACVDQGRLPAIIPSTQERQKAEDMLLNSDVREAYIGLHADVRVPENAWRWEAKQWRHFKFRAPWALDNVHDGNKRCAVISPDGWRTENCETRLTQYVCLGRAKNGAATGKFRYFIRTSDTPLTYNQAADKCYRAGNLIAIIPSSKTNDIIFKAAEEESKNEVFKAWIGLRAEGDETEVEWAWSNGRPLGAETFTESQVMRFNEDAARKNKKCIVARVEYNQVGWFAESCDVERYHMCSLNPADNAYEDSLSRTKRNNNVIMVSNRGARPDSLAKLNDAQDSNEFNPKYSQFDELENLVSTSQEEEYPATSSLVDQLECVESIEGKSVEMSSKLNDLDHKIADTNGRTDELDSKLDQMESTIAQMESEIAEINAVEQNIEDAENLNNESAELANEANDDMDDLEEYTVNDFQIEAVEQHTAEYAAHDLDSITVQVNDARKKAGDFKKKYGQMCADFPIACNSCDMADSGEIECDLDRFIDLKQLIVAIANNTDGATELLDEIKAKYLEIQSLASGGKTSGCNNNEAQLGPDFTSLQNVYNDLKAQLDDLIDDDTSDIPMLNDFDIDRFSNIEQLYNEIRQMLYGNSTDEQIGQIDSDPTIWNDIHGLEGAVNFVANPGCWREGEECDYKTDFSSVSNQEAMQINQDWMNKYQGLIEDAVQGAKEDMDITDGGIQNNIDGIENTIKSLKADMDAADNDQQELDHTVGQIQHLIASTRSMLDRIPQARNGQKMGQAMWFEPQLPDDAAAFGDSTYSFELTVNARVRRTENNILFVGEETNSLAIDTDDQGHVVANFITADTAYSVKSESPLPVKSAAWHQISFVKNGRRIAVSHECVHNCEEAEDLATAERGDVRRKRKRRNRHSKRHLRNRREADECDGSTPHCFLPYESTAWPIDFYKISTGEFYMYVGAYYSPLQEVYAKTGNDLTGNMLDSADYNGFEGDINGIEINRHLITPFHFKSKKTTEGDNAALKVLDPIPEPQQCFDNRRNTFKPSRADKECPCLDGQNSYITYTAGDLDIVFREELRGHLEFTYTSLADKYVMGAIFSEDGEYYMVILKANDEYKLHIRGTNDNTATMYNSTCTAYSPDQTNLINLRFGIMKQPGQATNLPRQAGILQWLTDYRPSKEQLHSDHLIEIPFNFWGGLWKALRNRNFYLGGIPTQFLPDTIRSLLTDYGIVTTRENDQVSIASMPACITKLNINHDHKNNEQTMESIDAKGLYRNNQIPIRHDILYQPGQRRGTEERGNKKVERDFGADLLEDSHQPELSFGLKLHKLDGEIINFDNTGVLQIVNKQLTLSVGEETQSIKTAVKSSAFYAVIIASDASGTKLTVVDGETIVGTLNFAGQLSLSKFTIGSDDGADFEAVIADLRYQSVKNNYDVMNGDARERNAKSTPAKIDSKGNLMTPLTPWYVCSGWKCSGVQYNTMYSFN